MTRQIAVLISDKHAGSALSLLPPNVELTDPNTGDVERPQLNYIQQKLWDWFSADRDAVLNWAAGDPITVFDLGDPTQGNRFPSELVTTSAAEQILIAIEVSKQYARESNVKQIYQVAGTDVHEFGESTASLLIAKHLETEFKHLKVKVLQHGLEAVEGVTFDVAHHGPSGGSRDWLRGNILRLYTQSVMQEDIKAGRTPPDVLLRGHFHTYVPERITMGHHETLAMVLPSWQWPNIHALKVAKSPTAFTVGTIALALEDGEIVGKPWRSLHTVDLRTKEHRHFFSHAEKPVVGDDY